MYAFLKKNHTYTIFTYTYTTKPPLTCDLFFHFFLIGYFLDCDYIWFFKT